MRIEQLVEFMDSFAPVSLSLEYDNVGLLVGRRDKEVRLILTSLDCTLEVVREAVEKGCDAIVCHHPILFSGVKRITDDTKDGEMLLSAIENDIAIFACHTNLDFAQGGLNDYFLEKLGYSAIDTIVDNEGRIFDAEGITMREMCEKVKASFDLKCVRMAGNGEDEVVRCAVCTGSGKSLIKEAAEKADCYITGDMGHHDIMELRDMGCGYIEISHYDSEKIAMELLKALIEAEFADVDVFMSAENKNPLTIV